MKWTAYDYTFAALMLGGFVGLYVLGRRFVPARRRSAYVALLVVLFALIWVDGAVGIFD